MVVNNPNVTSCLLYKIATQNNKNPVIYSTKKAHKDKCLAIKLESPIFLGHEIIYSWTAIASEPNNIFCSDRRVE